ncbi:OadG family protein [Nitratiruptor tergarcus]|uniref:Probable oxaloacetate decarboxylase gamma chain n=1 Tax=Nitratiruptor tergarcus DSM 16512 TaxID=1069081 RepID=A0A1W1WUQ8_9BACT|nr:OadG family protein [Nitratiruptor tergarcus]SMC10017.1 oxaloacetate decarboxylase, gamma subunit [Nitratiruptor tergarcus DSM 16512]
MILEAVKYMILGMGVVYLFLIMMVWVLNWQHKLLLKYFPESFQKPEEKTTSKREKLKKVAAITAALHHMKNS